MILMTNLFMLQASEPYLFLKDKLAANASDHDKPEFVCVLVDEK